MLSLPEQLLLLATDDVSGNDSLGKPLDRALIAAALLDLHLQERIVRHEPGNPAAFGDESEHAWINTAYFVSGTATTTGQLYLDLVFGKIATHPLSNRLHTFSTLVLLYLNRANAVSLSLHLAPPAQRLLVAEDLLAREALVAKESRLFGLLLETRLPEGNRDTGEAQLRCDLQSVVGDSGFPADNRFRCLLLLIQAMQFVPAVWGAAKQDVADWRIAQSLRLTMQPDSILADARRYIMRGIVEEDLQPLRIEVSIPR